MNYSKALFMLWCSLILMSACQKKTLETYDHPANIYFNLDSTLRDSIVFTFAYDMSKMTDTVYIPTRIIGHRTASERYYSAYVEQDSSTAVASVHYEPLVSRYPIFAHAGQDSLPLIVYNTPDLEEKPVSLIIKLQGTTDLDTVYIPTRIIGHRTASERYYSAYVEQDSSTAVASVHYEPLVSRYPIFAHAGQDSLPLIVYNTPDLEEKPVSLIIKLQGTTD